MNGRRIIFALSILLGLSATASAQSLQNLAESKRDCAVCHLEWSPDFEKPGAVLLMDKPAISMASRETTCLGCHDGSVRDSRKKVWQEQSHKNGIKPPADMKIPARLPLEDGKIACRTCHTAHNAPGGEDLSSTFFLRMDNDQSQLCKTCHPEKGAGPSHGSHPVGPMTIAMPANLLAAGAKSGPKGQELICQSCHTPHGSKSDKLLVVPVFDNVLCSSCHEKLRPGQWGAEGHTHPVNVALSSDAQRKAIADMQTHTGPGGTLACLSCHRLHDSPPQNGRLLADTLVDSRLCLRCHPENASVAGTVHDLRKTAPTTQNALGQTVKDAGPCSACHIPHRAARAPVIARGDPYGECSACHAAGRLAAAKGATHFNHPDDVSRSQLPAGLVLAVNSNAADPDRAQLTCMTCHNPHDGTREKFLRNKPDDLCGSCHVDQKATLAGSHDLENRPKAVNGLGKTAAQTGKCGFCHNVHLGNGPTLWIATSTPPTKAADDCLQCHNKNGLAAAFPAPTFSHPTGVISPATQPSAVPLPLYDAAGTRVASGGLVQCASCHNPHADSRKSSRMLRVQGNTSDLCLRCHSEKASLDGGIHDSRSNANWPGTKAGKDLCMGCHRAHGNDAAKKLWAVAPAADVTTADGVCIACHPTKRWADPNNPTPTAGAMMHTQLLPTTRPMSANADVIATAADCPLPLVPAIGSEDRTHIGCKTCHNPHSGKGSATMLRTPDPTKPEGVCFQCHRNETMLDSSMHAKKVLAVMAGSSDAIAAATSSKRLCAPCHAVHAVDGSQHAKLWASKLEPLAVTPNEQRCLGCHDDQTAPRPQIPTHPSVVFDLLKWTAPNPDDLPEYLPTDRSFACNVCHLPHGSKDAPEVEKASVPLSDKQSIVLRGATKPMIRRSVPHQLCVTCHGADADRVFLYYHHPQQRQDIRALQDPSGALDDGQ
jgi:predicted CXXCH cytochrome family protein